METISDDMREFYRDHHEGHGHYGSTGARNAGPEIVRTLENRQQVRDVLDFGAGKGTLGEYITERLPRIHMHNYDPAIPGIDVVPKGTFDAVVSSDCLEHVEEADLPAVVETIRQKARQSICLYIACSLTGHLLPDGRDLHVTIKTPEEWRGLWDAVPGLKLMEFRKSELWKRSGTKSNVYLVYDVVA